VAQAGDVIENPVTGQRLTFLATARDTGGEVFRAEGAFPPGGFAGVEHIHPFQDENFEFMRSCRARPPGWVQHLTFRVLTPIARMSRRRLPTCRRTRADAT
jgi:hypothetical protein